jgi:hypothetical protein
MNIKCSWRILDGKKCEREFLREIMKPVVDAGRKVVFYIFTIPIIVTGNFHGNIRIWI